MGSEERKVVINASLIKAKSKYLAKQIINIFKKYPKPANDLEIDQLKSIETLISEMIYQDITIQLGEKNDS